MPYTKESIHAIVEAQRRFFRTGKTLDIDWRIRQLKRLKKSILDRQERLEEALREDLGRSATESFFCDILPTVAEINEIIAGLARWSRPERHFSGLMCFPSRRTTVYKLPYGVTLLMSPYNFPIILTLSVLAASICGGNTAVIKASSKSPACTKALQELLSEIFPEKYVALIDGGHDVADLCLEERFDKIFYTGSPAVAKKVLAAAAGNITPTALELGGETGNWCIVRKDANLRDAARKIAFFKLLNAGQICININQVAVAREAAPEFLEALKREFKRQIGDSPLTNEEYPRLISEAAFDKCSVLADSYRDRIVYGGTGDRESRRYAPTVIYPVQMDEEIVKRELFCPLLPVVPFPDAEIDTVLRTIADREHPLSLYIFTADKPWARRVMQTQQYGGGCINEVCLHIMVKGVPFNGTGHSGMGAYHGEWGFREFTHPSAVLEGSTHFNLSLREHPYAGPYGAIKRAILKRFAR